MFEGFSFAKPIFLKTKENEKAFEYLDEVMVKMKTKKKKEVDTGKQFAYDVQEHKITIIVPPELEEAIRCGEVETLSLNKDCKMVQLKIKSGRIIKLNLENIPKEEVESSESIHYGEGQSKDVIVEQQKVINERNKRKQETMARKKLFEDKEKKEEELERRDIERPKSKKPLKFTLKKREEKMENMDKLMKEQKDNKAIALPKFNPEVHEADPDEVVRYEKMLEEIANAQKVSRSLTVCATEFDWKEARAAASGFDWDSFPQEEELTPIEVESPHIDNNKIVAGPHVYTLDIVAAVETIEPVATPTTELVEAINEFKNEEKMAKTERVIETIKEFDCVDVVATFDEIGRISENMHRANIGFLVQKDGDTQFVPKCRYVDEGEDKALAGALIEVDENKAKKFVTGQIINLADEETFVAGQTVASEEGKQFVPGHTVVNLDGEVKFIPGHCVKNQEGNTMFLAGQTLDSPEGPKFVPGQMIDRGDGKPVFVPGQTITTSDGPKFVPGEVVKDEDGFDCFVPGLPMPTDAGDTFVPGQTFQDNTGNFSFTPGQIVDTVEGPVFVPGKSFKTEEGDRKFVKGEIVQEEGKLKFMKKDFVIPSIQEDLVIPTDELVPIAIARRDVIGFTVNPTNTKNMERGQKLIGDMVENESSVQFFLTGKMPDKMISEAEKIISGQLNVGEDEQRFIPGRMINKQDGEERFVPGQLVMTSHGEDFVPGQIVETQEGPKFVPGQLVMTSEGEKFVPGQVIVEKSGPKFVPGQIIQTKNGATFIPGQMMNTNAGQKFVPGQLVDSVDGPRFVPGQVIETVEGPKFVPGTVIETEDGLKYVPHEAEESGEDIEIAFQGFEVTPEEMHLLTTNPTDTRAHSPIANEQCLIDNRMLKRLASDTMEVHGTTPEPQQPDKKKRKKTKKKVAIDAPDDDEEEDEAEKEALEVDSGTDKLEIVKMLFNAANTLSNVKKSREIKKLGTLLGDEASFTFPIQTIAVAKILSSVTEGDMDIVKTFLGSNDDLINDVMSQIGSLDNLTRNDEVKKMISKALQSVVTNKCNKEISKLITRLKEDPSSLMTDTKTQILLTEAVGIVCVTGNVEIASLLEKFISEPSDPSVLTDDPDVMTVLRQLIVLHEIADRDEETANLLHQLQTDPEGVKSRKQIRALLKKANKLLIPPSDHGKGGKEFDVRHVASSRDIPADVFEQIKADKEEAEKFFENLPDELFHAIMGDDRCGNQVLEGLDKTSKKAKADIARFRDGMAVVIAQSSVQAVIPRRYARSVYYGIMPYLLIDEQGFKFFERGLTGRKLAPSKVIENTWCKEDDYYKKQILFTKSGERCSVNLMGISAPSLQYTCLLPTSEPRVVTRDALLQERRSSRSRRPSVDSSRRSSASSLHGDYSFSGGYPSSLAMAPYEPSPYVTNHVDAGSYMSPSSYVPNFPESAYVPEPSYVPDPIYTNGYGDPGMYGAMVPYESPVLEPIVPVKRSDTVGRLLDKYCNFSTEREFGYHKPTGAYNKYSKRLAGNPTSRYDSVEDESDILTGPPAGRPKPRKSSTERNTLDPEFGLPNRFSNIYEEDEETATSPPVKYGGSRTSRFLSPDSSAGNDRQSRLRSVDPSSASGPTKQNKYKGSQSSRFLSPEVPEHRRNISTSVLEDPFSANAGYFDMGRFDDPIADRYARNVSSYTLPGELDEKYGRSKLGYQGPIIGDPSTYGMQGVSDYFTPNYNSRYKRYNFDEPTSYNEPPRNTYNGNMAEPEEPRKQPPSRYGNQEEDSRSYGGNRKNSGYDGAQKQNGTLDEDDEAPNLSKRISRFLQPKERDTSRSSGRYSSKPKAASKYSSARDQDDEAPPYGGRPRYGRTEVDLDEDLAPPSYRKPQKSYGANRRMTTPGLMSSYGADDDDSAYTPSRYSSRSTKPSAIRESLSPGQDNSYSSSRYGGETGRYGGDKAYGRKSSVRDAISPGHDSRELPRRTYGSANRYGSGGEEFCRPSSIGRDPDDRGREMSRNPRSSMVRTGPTIGGGPYSDLIGDEDRPWRRHTSVAKRTPYVPAPSYDDDDDNSGYNPKFTERKLASRIAKQYLGGEADDED